MRLSHDDFEKLYRQHNGPLLAYLAGHVQPRTDVPDVAQEVWTRVWKGLGQFDGSKFRPWLFEIARNYAIDRSRRRRPQPLPEDFDVAAPLARLRDLTALDGEQREGLERCLQHMGLTERELIYGRLRGEEYDDLSAALGLTVQQARRLFHTTKTHLIECVGRDEQ